MNTYIFPNGCLPSMRVIERAVKQRTDMRPSRLQDITSHYVRDAASLARQLRGKRCAGSPSSATTSAFSASGRLYLVLLRGGLCRAAHRRRAGAVGQAVLAGAARPGSRRPRMRSVAPPEVAAVSSHADRPSPVRSGSGLATWSSAEQPSGHRVEHERGPARASIAKPSVRQGRARACRPRSRSPPSPPTPRAARGPSRRCPCGVRIPRRWRSACRLRRLG